MESLREIVFSEQRSAPPRGPVSLPGPAGVYPRVRLVLGVALLVACSTAVPAKAAEQASVPVAIDPDPVPAGDRSEFLRRMNVSKAYLETGRFADAITSGKRALELEPGAAEAWRNLARACLFSGDPEAALGYLDQSLDTDPGSVAAAYLRGIALARQSRFADAVPVLEETARRDPGTAAVRYQLAQAYRGAGREDRALEQLREATRLDPRNMQAQLALALSARDAGREQEYRERLGEFDRLRDRYGEPSTNPMVAEACIHTVAEAARAAYRAGQAAGMPAVDVTFTDVTENVFMGDADRSAAALALLDMDDEGRYRFLAIDPGGELSELRWQPNGRFQRENVGARVQLNAPFPVCLVGNFHDDLAVDQGRIDGLLPDVLVIDPGGIHVLQATSPQAFSDVTESTGLATLTGQGARWVDYDHDGDLDLLVARAAGLALWQNNGNATFEDVTAASGMANTTVCADIEIGDFDGNGSIDVAAARGADPTLVYENRRAARMGPRPALSDPWPAARRLLVNDLNSDGLADVVLVGETTVTVVPGGHAPRETFALSGMEVEAATLFDYDNDGRLDVGCVGRSRSSPDRGQVRVWRRDDGGRWAEVTTALGLEAMATPPLRDVLAADVDADGDTDLLLLTTGSRLRLLSNEGGHINGQVKVRLLSLITANRGGIGARVQARAADFLVTRTLQRERPVELGLGGRKHLDSVQSVWPDGLVYDQIEVEVGDAPLDLVVSKFVVTGWSSVAP